jgi:hypothetical protein
VDSDASTITGADQIPDVSVAAPATHVGRVQHDGMTSRSPTATHEPTCVQATPFTENPGDPQVNGGGVGRAVETLHVPSHSVHVWVFETTTQSPIATQLNAKPLDNAS